MHQYLHQVASVVNAVYGDDFYEALNVAESILQEEGNIQEDAQRVHAVLEGEI